MHSRTIAILDRLEKTALFSRVGNMEGADVAVLSSWRQAIGSCDTLEWENLRNDVLNNFRRSLEKKNAYGDWDDATDEVKMAVRPLVDRKIAPVARENALPRIFGVRVFADIVLFCLAVEYADVLPPGLFTRLGQWYLDGHFPCGWLGIYPKGKLVIY